MFGKTLFLPSMTSQFRNLTRKGSMFLPFEPNIGVPIISVNYLGATNVWHCDS
jgi:hypothetical protein